MQYILVFFLAGFLFCDIFVRTSVRWYERRSRLTESSSSSVRVVASTRFDDIELYSKPFPTRAAAEAYIGSSADEVVTYSIEGDNDNEESPVGSVTV